ncbi:MAG: 50S ribosomal protein L3 [Candidatus Daviesbacteria bacterium GW2011_GWA2_38_24]|uniref:Large ribosomal subunit protein uL3 n=1 Tax=Candidatus Daviesbacteria bacterium GW2011_GWA2_38_24 TaxID=1618422 RepID=A0A0G0JWD3_9BACT|nr:MAG: 50S ribosomal protein L3 [Candidatus Daviesbacteria bacterium GW2011_GWA2_38_24]OGE24528.1 MAG: 50S ribosomal protein L3 [Candidatus Daviesbacteria bacterium RIFCSPHIGHO2_01_FULL_38_8]
MINTLLGVKKGMISSYDARGRRVGATILEITPNYVTQVKTSDGKDGYNAVQIGAGAKKSVRKPQLGHLKKAKIEAPLRWMKELRVEEIDVEPGLEIKSGQVFSKGDAVKVTGISKGRGFQGGVKRYGFAGGPKTHGQSDRHRAPGSIGSGTTPGRVLKGKRMAGHMGVEQVSYSGLEVIAVDRKNNLLTVKGGVPGYIGSLVIVEKQGRIKGYTPPPEEKEESQEAAVPEVNESESKGE